MSDPVLVSSGIPDLIPMVRSGDPSRHVSFIIRSLCIKLGHFEDDGASGPNQTRLELGCAFEDAVAHGLARRYALSAPSRYVVPGEFTREGLIGTPDLLDSILWAIIEIKLTWLSSNHEPDSIKFWKYWVQAMAYCKMIESRTAFLHIGHIDGNYNRKNPSGPIYNVWRRDFDQSEIDNNWRMIVTHGEVLRSEMDRGKIQ